MSAEAQLRTDTPPGHDRAAPARSLVDLLPPAMVALVIAFWAFAPASLLQNPMTFIGLSLLLTLTILALEIPFERHRDWRMTPREFATDMFYVALSTTVIAWLTQHLAEDPLRALKASLGITTAWAAHMPFLAQVALVIFVVEFGQYWMHRLMHNVHPFWLTHAPHHHITQLNAAKGYVGNPVELFLISLSVVALFDLDAAAVFCGINVLGVVSGFAHANVRANPPKWYAFVFTTISHHSLHHSTGYDETRSNYANSLILLDRVFGTFREGEASVVGQDERKRLSVWEQATFPLRPLIERRRARHQGETRSADRSGAATA